MDYSTRQLEFFMSEALDLARKGWGKTSPNPMVGAVIVRDGIITGRGYHHAAGMAHAEVEAINDAGDTADGADIFVNLEPCSTRGRTPACTDAVIAAGIKRVFTGSTDPNPRHCGRAAEIFKNAKIDYCPGILKRRCDVLNEAFFKFIKDKKPFVLLKMASTLDGRTATVSGDSKWVSGRDARLRVQYLRQWADAVMVGANTARMDNPGLNVRNVRDWEKQPRRIIISNSLTAAEAQTLLAPGTKAEVYAPADKQSWHKLMRQLGSENVMSILVEGGGELAAVLLRCGVVDKVEFHIAPKILGGRDSKSSVAGVNPEKMSEAVNLRELSYFNCGEDLIITGYL